MKHANVLRSILLAFIIILFVVFGLIAFICLAKNYFHSFFSPFFSYLDSIGVTAAVLLLIGGCSLILGLLLYRLWDKL